MAKVVSFPSNETEREVIYFEVFNEGDPHYIKMKRFGNGGLIESELTVIEIN